MCALREIDQVVDEVADSYNAVTDNMDWQKLVINCAAMNLCGFTCVDVVGKLSITVMMMLMMTHKSCLV